MGSERDVEGSEFFTIRPFFRRQMFSEQASIDNSRYLSLT